MNTLITKTPSVHCGMAALLKFYFSCAWSSTQTTMNLFVVLFVINQFHLSVSVSPISTKRQLLLKKIKEKMLQNDTSNQLIKCPEACICLEKGVTRCMFLRLKRIPDVPQITERL